VLDIAPVGYRGFISLATYDQLPTVGERVKLWIHAQYREDEHILFAFFALEERWLFEHLISVNGVGPKLAITMLSSMRPEAIRQAVTGGDAKRLQSIPKIGAKIAERIVLELKKKLNSDLPDFASASSFGESSDIMEAVDALTALGFTRLEAERAVHAAYEKGAVGAEELVKRSLRAG
jgi:Holliday junction DNA helicase RuvA